jgi:undecaprenyl-diphosphatase
MQLFRHGDTLTSGMTGWILLGSLVSFVVAIVVVKAFISIITRYGFAPFAWYRIVAGAGALVWLSMR